MGGKGRTIAPTPMQTSCQMQEAMRSLGLVRLDPGNPGAFHVGAMKNAMWIDDSRPGAGKEKRFPP